MKIRGNKSGAESSNITSYFLSNKLSNKVIALNLKKIPIAKTNFLTITSPSITIVHFTTDN